MWNELGLLKMVVDVSVKITMWEISENMVVLPALGLLSLLVGPSDSVGNMERRPVDTKSELLDVVLVAIDPTQGAVVGKLSDITAVCCEPGVEGKAVAGSVKTLA
jgi:hypothetical protein